MDSHGSVNGLRDHVSNVQQEACGDILQKQQDHLPGGTAAHIGQGVQQGKHHRCDQNGQPGVFLRENVEKQTPQKDLLGYGNDQHQKQYSDHGTLGQHSEPVHIVIAQKVEAVISPGEGTQMEHEKQVVDENNSQMAGHKKHNGLADHRSPIAGEAVEGIFQKGRKTYTVAMPRAR